jgi:hypothetical protein
VPNEPVEKSQAAQFYENRLAAIAWELKRLYRENPDETLDKFLRRSEYTQYSQLLNVMAEEAQNFAKSRGMSADDFRGGPLSDAMDVCEELRTACHLGEDDPKLIFLVWQHQHVGPSDFKTLKPPPIDRDALEATVGRYLQLPFRAQMVDRIMVDALIAYETIFYAHEMWRTPAFPMFSTPSPIKQAHVFKSWIIGSLFNLALFGGAAALVFYLGTIHAMGDGWSIGIGLSLIGILVLLSAISTMALPFAWRNQVKARTKVAELMADMLSTYKELRSDGPVSAHRTHELATRSSAKGVAWPSSLYTLLEDIKKREGRF